MPSDGSVSFQDVTSAYAVINLIGPKSRDLLQKVAPGDLSNEGFPFSACKSITVGYAPVMAFRVTYVGELGYELYVPSESACHVYGMIWEGGRNMGISNGGYRMIASMHLEKGYADWGSELTPEYTPFDVGLGFCVALDKGDFIGRDALAKVKKEGAPYKLCTFTIDAGKPLMMQNSAPIIYKDEVLGVTTSVGYGHTLGKNICYGYLPIAHVGHEDGFKIESYGETYTAKLEYKRALYDPEREKILM